MEIQSGLKVKVPLPCPLDQLIGNWEITVAERLLSQRLEMKFIKLPLE